MVIYTGPANDKDEPIDAAVILFVGGLYLVLPVGEDDDWLMGEADS
ncbi:MAG: hypothetical protein QOK28_3543, partial [Actinomycetota bacterium]